MGFVYAGPVIRWKTLNSGDFFAHKPDFFVVSEIYDNQRFAADGIEFLKGD